MHRPLRASAGLVVTLALVVALGGCQGEGTPPGRAPATTGNPTGPTGNASSTTAQVVDETAAVLKAYAEHWPAFDAFLSGRPPGDPADYFAGVRLSDLPRSVADFAEKGLEIQGAAELAPGKVTIVGNKASFTDCHLDSTSAVSRSTGEVVFPPATTPKTVAVELFKSAGRWKVSSVVYGDETCVQ